MDKIIGYSNDDLVVKILSFLPTKVAVSTSVLSKHWKFLWMHVPKLEFDDDTNTIYLMICARKRILSDQQRLKYARMRSFIDTNLPLHSSPIESLRLNLLTEPFQPEDIKRWVEIAVSRYLRELSITCLDALLPSSLYTCKSLVTLKLSTGVRADVPRVVCLPSLKILHLRRVKYANEESLQRLLYNCSVLQDLTVEGCEGDNVRKFDVIIPSLLSLSFQVYDLCTCDGYVIDTPSLKYFKANDYNQSSPWLIVNMPHLEEADIGLSRSPNVKKLLEPVTFVKRLSLFLVYKNAEAVYGDDIVFSELEHLKFHIGNRKWPNLLFWLLKSSPKLRHLEFDGYQGDTSVCWKELVYVPQCLLLSLQTFKLTCYNYPTAEVRDQVTYILRNSFRLNTAAFLISSYIDPQKKIEMKNEFLSCSRGSATCNLVFSDL